MPLFGSPPPPPPPFSYAQCYADFLTNALGEPSVLRAFLLTVGVATFVALPLIAILNADKVVKPDKPIIHKHPLFNPNVQRDLNFPTYAQCSAFFFAVYLIAVGTAINVAPVRTHAFFQSTIICGGACRSRASRPSSRPTSSPRCTCCGRCGRTRPPTSIRAGRRTTSV